MSYRPGQRRGSPHQVVLPGPIEIMELAEDLLAAVIGDVDQVRILGAILRPGVFAAAPEARPEPLVIPGLQTIGTRAGGSRSPD